MFSSDVLPAPLGPITETRSPCATSRLTRLTACTPPKALETSRISSRALIRWLAILVDRALHSSQPPLAPPVVLDVTIALALPDTAQPQVELADVLVLADGLGVAVQHDAASLHHVGILGMAERHRGVLLGQQHRHLLRLVEPAHDLEDLGHQH